MSRLGEPCAALEEDLVVAGWWLGWKTGGGAVGTGTLEALTDPLELVCIEVLQGSWRALRRG